jgi:hypothetical protein
VTTLFQGRSFRRDSWQSPSQRPESVGARGDSIGRAVGVGLRGGIGRDRCKIRGLVVAVLVLGGGARPKEP